MKPSIHPTFYTDATVTCSCGNTFVTGSIKKEIRVEICSHCHPLYTGEKRYVDTLGRVDKFQQKQKTAEERKKKSVVKRKGKTDKTQDRPKTLREILGEI